jgi:4'-phosphopantetheinyl transferase
MSEDEQVRMCGFANEVRKRQFALSRLALRRLASGYLGVAPRKLTFKRTEFGKPYVIAPFPHDLEFSLSRSSDYALIAFARSMSVGVDIELVQNGILSSLSAIFLSERERLTTSGDPQRTLFAMWSRKEALVKGLGIGTRVPLEALELVKSDAADNAWRWEGENGYWFITDISVPDGYTGALATFGAPPSAAVLKLL